MRHFMVVLVVGAMTFALSGCGGGGGDTGAGETAEPEAVAEAPSDAPAAAAVNGEAVYVANCATCHGDAGLGDGPASIGLEPPPQNLTDNEWSTGDGSPAAIVEVISGGSSGTAMIGWQGTLTDEEIAAVAEYVLALSSGE